MGMGICTTVVLDLDEVIVGVCESWRACLSDAVSLYKAIDLGDVSVDDIHGLRWRHAKVRGGELFAKLLIEEALSSGFEATPNAAYAVDRPVARRFFDAALHGSDLHSILTGNSLAEFSFLSGHMDNEQLTVSSSALTNWLRGKKAVLISFRSMSETLYTLVRFGLSGCFDMIVTDDALDRGARSHDVVRDYLGASERTVSYFTDVPAHVSVGVALGFRCVGIAHCGEEHASALRESGAEAVLCELSEWTLPQ